MNEVTARRDTYVFRVSLPVRLGSLIGTIVVVAVPVFMFALAALAFGQSRWALGSFVLAVGGFMAGLALYVLRDCRGKWGLRIVLGADAVTLDLPSGRSMIHRPRTQHVSIPYAAIAAVETRLEAYGTLGMAMMQRAYVLRPKNGELIFLFEERALATGLASSMFGGIAADLAARAGVTVKDIGMVEGRGGLLGVWGTDAPDWAAPALSPQRQRWLWARAAATGAMAAAAASTAPGMWLGGLARRRPDSEPPPN